MDVNQQNVRWGMMKALRIIVLWASLAVWAGGAVFADELMDSAEAFFKSYVDGGNQASASVVNYFADDARIIAVRHLPEGGTVRIETTGEKHKKCCGKHASEPGPVKFRCRR